MKYVRLLACKIYQFESPADTVAGSGKTLAYCVPLVNYVIEKVHKQDLHLGSRKVLPTAIILCPTRELAIQVHETLLSLCLATHVRPVCVYGGVPVNDQLRTMQHGATIVACTPGRLRHLFHIALKGPVVNQGIYPHDLTHVVFDEADKLLSSDTAGEVDSIVETCKWSKNQISTWFFSSQYVTDTSERAMHIMDILGRKELIAEISFDRQGVKQKHTKVQQTLIEVGKSSKEKMGCLIQHFVQTPDPEKTLILARSRTDVDNIAKKLGLVGVPCLQTHGSHLQLDREKAVSRFQHGLAWVLVATQKLSIFPLSPSSLFTYIDLITLVGHGIDLTGIESLVFFDLPDTLDEYMLYLGRVARLGSAGKAKIFYSKIINS